MIRQWLTTALATGILASAGCRSYCREETCQPCPDIPRGAIPPAVGTHVANWQATQAHLAEADDFVVYQYEWAGETAALGPFGTRHLDGLAARLPGEPGPVVVEPSGASELDQARRAKLVEELAARGALGADALVVIGWPAAEGLHGQEAERLNRGYLQSGSRTGGGFGGGAPGGGSTFGGTGGFGTGGGGGGGFY
ncbi:MAG TPA: hypothetical protein VML55_08680 [Planctomycetaceae bacterium]|nr:hypothetical protein [Planctomycetaceae bacterium]